MKKVLLFFLVLCLNANLLVAQNLAGRDYGATETYRRSSLCLILLTHKGTQYANQMEQQFSQIPLPERYNDHNLTVRVFSVYGNQSRKDIDYKLYSNNVAKDLVKKWFNYDPYSGTMNMELIHQRGGYNASYEDLLRAENTERGVALLSEEGDELLQNTFVLVCDMDYYDKAQTGQVLSGLLAASSYVLDAYAQEQYRKGDTDAAVYSDLGSTLAMSGAAVASDMGGFAVNMKAYLYRLKWNDGLKEKMYSEYWSDESYPISERMDRKSKFESDRTSFGLEYIGMYRERSARTVFKSQNDLNKVIREVCATTINKGIENLAKNYPVFKPKTSFYCDGSRLYAYIGTKEGVKTSTKYEILETQKKKGEITYKRVGVAVPVTVWNNSKIDFSSDTDYSQYRGTAFMLSKGKSEDICDMGLQMREMGKAGYQYERHDFTIGYITKTMSLTSKEYLSDAESEDNEHDFRYTQLRNGYNMSWHSYLDCYAIKHQLQGFNMGWTINYNTNLSWSVISGDFLFGGNAYNVSFNTGVILRTRPLGKNGKFAFFVWPSLGYSMSKMSYGFTDEYNLYLSVFDKWRYEYTPSSKDLDLSYLNWDVKLGLNITEWLYVSCGVSSHSSMGLNVGFHL